MKILASANSKERKCILITALVATTFVFVAFAFDFVAFLHSYLLIFHVRPEFQLSGSNSQPLLPPFHFVILFILIALIKTKRFLLPLLLTALYAVMFVYGLYARYNGQRLGGEEFSPHVDFHNKLLRSATELDYVAASFILILLFWQISIALRILIKKINGKETLL